ncbi:hypothetical protein F0562_007920 [Nyssa sinensis]|uniref:Uncharacterized protein n=1 Tax=Nyssa sinensis TaxID=561372 RepID=A0A5J5A662_9ASTE|nr:hypothetical protein F0562_007920 [Nyssa sinensis]
MQTRMATCCKEKAVLVAVYVERPRKRRVSSNHYHHLHLHQPKHGVNGGGYNRRAELLDYSHRLRESARSGASLPSHPKPVSSNQQPLIQIFAAESKPKHAKVPSCLGKWKLMIPSFFGAMTISQAKKERKKKKKKNSGSNTIKMKAAIIKSYQVQKKRGFISKLLATLQKLKHK